MAYNPVIFRRFITALFVLFLNTHARYGTLPYRFYSACDQIEHIQKRALTIILPNMSYQESLSMLKLPTLTERRELLCMRFYKKNLCDMSSKLSELLPHPTYHQHNLRHARTIPLFKCHTKRFSDSCLPYCVKKWDAF